MKLFRLAAIVFAFGLTVQNVSAQISGSGSANYVPKFTGATSIGNSNMYINNTYNTGIGTTSASTLLHIVSNNTNGSSSNYLNMRLEKSLGSNQDNYMDVLFTSNPGGGGFTLGNGSASFRMNNNYGTSDMAFMHNSTSLGFVLKSSGNFGIGVASPLCKFQVQGAFSLFTSSTGNPASAAVIRGNSGYSTATTPDYAWWNNDQTGFFHPGADVIGFATGGGERMRVDGNGHVGINTTNTATTAYLTVNGKTLIGDPAAVNLNTTNVYGLYVQNGILASKVRVAVVNSANWADYVFATGYRLRPLSEIEQFIKTNKHLPEVPSAEDVVKEGIDMASMDATLLQKIEELTLYIIEQNKRIENLEKTLSGKQ